jgi:hypothetical protein
MIPCLHSDRADAPAFVFDVMEPERPKVDPRCARLSQIGGVASGGLYDPEDGS